MNNFKQLLYYLIGRVPAELHENSIKGKRLLHISDTPASFFGELARLIKILKPDYIVHTGDLVDNIKLELFPGSIWRYEKEVKKLIKLLEDTDAEKIYLALGNHDDAETVERLCKSAHIIKGLEIVYIEGQEFAITHYSDKIQEKPAACNLFGHNLDQKSGCIDGRLYLNGISSINVVELESMRHFSYPYPAETNNDRSRIGKFGL